MSVVVGGGRRVVTKQIRANQSTRGIECYKQYLLLTDLVGKETSFVVWRKVTGEQLVGN